MLRAIAGSVVCLLILPGVACAENALNAGALNGNCASTSTISSGPIGTDLTPFEKPFRCDGVTISALDADQRRILVRFNRSAAGLRDAVGFAGSRMPNSAQQGMGDDAIVLDSLYIGQDAPKEDHNGYCQFTFKEAQLTLVSCGAVLDENQVRTVWMLDFEIGEKK